MENLLNYTSDASSDDNSDTEIPTNKIKTSILNKNGAFIENQKNKNTNTNTINNTFNLKYENDNKKETTLVVRKEQQVTDFSYFKSSEYIQNQFMSLPSPKYQTTGYSNLNLNNELHSMDDDYRLAQTKKNIQHALQEENKRKREALYQSYCTSAQLNSTLDKPVRPYVSKRLKKNISSESGNYQNLSQSSLETSSIANDQCLTENSKKVLYINSSFLPKPSSDYLKNKKFTHIIPSHTVGQLYGHTKGVNVLRWKPDDGYLLASASMDYTACIWDVFHSKKPSRIIPHQGAVKDIQWRNDNTHVLTASFDKTIKLFDVEAGKVIQTFTNDDMVNVLRFHPKDRDLFIAGLYKKGIVCWDARSNRVVSEYKGFFGEVQDLEFLDEGKSFLAASDIIKRNSTDKAIVVWDFAGNVILSNQIYQEAYNCTALRIHPNKKRFIAQSNAGYIAIFDTKSPWTLNKFKRFESHSVSGNRIQCNFSPDGRYIGSGSSDGRLYFYDWNSAKCIKRLDYGVHANATCIDVAWCPQPQRYGNACVASCDNKGRIALWI
ncbi:WD40 repeat-like protein [Piromyces finnis]|uniref:WD40 repeat-like protein n=1 Tax=Piromyces finnis TaxID=1754191 RepID=A0A1Y1UYC1_9FUNG|nr:WD40 repeat-like protein [Piromyces finnis]|eukprot:ORX42747.1 WD40 repeat-like protein [Piromyces finnis]